MPKRKPVVVLATGGTGGHIFPAQALAESLLGNNIRVAILTDERGLSFLHVPQEIKTFKLPLGRVKGNGFLNLLQTFFMVLKSSFFTYRTLHKLKPDLVIGFGGYPSAATMLCATLMRIPKMIHEQNAILGRTNRVLARFVKRIALSFRETLKVPRSSLRKTRFTGMPVRSKIKALAKIEYAPPTPPEKFNILVLGGSQGAAIFSNILPQALVLLKQKERSCLSLVQQCRPEHLEDTKALYKALNIEAEVTPFFDDIPERLKKAHVLISRSGSSTVSEVIASKRPAILVPYAYATDNHQLENARQIEQVRGGWIIEEHNFTPQKMASLLQSILTHPNMLKDASEALSQLYSENATDALAKEVENLLSKT